MSRTPSDLRGAGGRHEDGAEAATAPPPRCPPSPGCVPRQKCRHGARLPSCPIGGPGPSTLCEPSAGAAGVSPSPATLSGFFRTHFSATAQHFLMRNLRTGRWYWTPSVNILISLLYSLTSMSLEIHVLKQSEMPRFQNQTPSLLLTRSSGSAGTFATSQVHWGHKGQRLLKHTPPSSGRSGFCEGKA